MVKPIHENGFFEKRQITVPAGIINEYVKNTFFKNALYITEIGSLLNASYYNQLNEGNSSDYLLIYCQNGKGHCETRNDLYTIRKNQFMLLSPNQFSRFQADPENHWDIYWMRFSGTMMNELKTVFDLEQFEKPTSLTCGHFVSDIWQKIYSCLSEGFELENIGYANLNLQHLISLLAFHHKEKKNVQEDEDQLEQSILFMKEHLNKHLTVESIANELNYSSSHYSTLFKQKTGLSPIDYFIRLKIQYACQLLNKSNLIIKEISQKVGYDDPFYFSRIFKKVTGKSPAEYKAELKPKNTSRSLSLQQLELVG
jgi:AraC-like DNA-binding protein